MSTTLLPKRKRWGRGGGGGGAPTGEDEVFDVISF